MIYIGNGMYSDSGPNNYLQHYGRKGMKWGQHIFGDTDETAKKYNYSSQEAERRLSNTDNFYNKYIRRKNVWINPYNKAADRMEPYIKEINGLFKNKTLNIQSYLDGNGADKTTKEYLTKLQNKWESIYKEEIDKVYKNYADKNLTPDYYNTFPMMQSFYIDTGSKSPVKQSRSTQHRWY